VVPICYQLIINIFMVILIAESHGQATLDNVLSQMSKQRKSSTTPSNMTDKHLRESTSHVPDKRD
jgi:hypothetical protein